MRLGRVLAVVILLSAAFCSIAPRATADPPTSNCNGNVPIDTNRPLPPELSDPPFPHSGSPRIKAVCVAKTKPHSEMWWKYVIWQSGRPHLI